jgi:hypothetical protein
MIGWVVGRLLAAGGIIAGWFVTRDAPNFGVIQMVMSLLLLTFVVAVIAPGSPEAGLPSGPQQRRRPWTWRCDQSGTDGVG